jgi:hypothetical protein
MADNNLSINVTADVSKLRAQLAIQPASMREFGAQMRQAASMPGVSSIDPKLNALAAQYEAASASVRRFSAELKASSSVRSPLEGPAAPLGA